METCRSTDGMIRGQVKRGCNMVQACLTACLKTFFCLLIVVEASCLRRGFFCLRRRLSSFSYLLISDEYRLLRPIGYFLFEFNWWVKSPFWGHIGSRTFLDIVGGPQGVFMKTRFDKQSTRK